MPYAHSFFDLEKLYADTLRKELTEMGFDVSDIPDRKVGIYYHDVAGRLITQRPRKVFFASDFSCPAKHREGLGNLIRAIQRGENLTPYQSTGIFRNIKKTDKLFYDWSIHHFHLGREINTSGRFAGRFVVRTDEVAFAMVVANAVVFLKTADHNHQRNPLVWSDIELMESVLTAAPELLKTYEINGSSERILNAEQRENLRKSNCNTALTLSNGKSYWSPGGGFMSSGVSFQASMKDMHIRRDLDYVSKVLYNDHSRAIANFYAKISKHPERVETELLKIGELYICKVKDSKKAVFAYPRDNQKESTLEQKLRLELTHLSHTSYAYNPTN